MHEKITGASLPAPLALAYLGDAVYSLYVRRRLIAGGCEKSGELSEAALGYVTAEAQATLMRRMEPHLTEDEHDVFRRASNSKKLRRPKHASASDYRLATGFEAVLGMLFWIGDISRIDELLHAAEEGAPQGGAEIKEKED